MAADEADDLAEVIPPLLQALEGLGYISRRLNPPDLPAVLRAVGAPDEALRAALPKLDAWPERLAPLAAPIRTAADAALAGFTALREVEEARGLFRALR